ncbi:ATP-binding protein [Limnofasciculus baicalensis]|uniref:ATP-binding protein n=1 Tax=Limnofasciculus baicalensis BBK-W-15 TaxID=2699891 RepID=A0AAE3GQV5_9CYAN|nr:ATP-binding protein [Limnofasciculus baicalensis]MCP2728869.1 ATP-binding protein [Limnofasciculus baicalensis BBK-W-15]
MIIPSNPYNWQRVNPDLFYGRIELANNLVNRLANGKSFGITGGRRMGKTTLLRRVEKDLLSYAENVRNGGLLVLPIYLETIELPNLSADSIYQEIARQICDKLNHHTSIIVPNCQEVKATNFKEYLGTITNLIKEADYRPQIIFIFDEIEGIIASDWGRQFFPYWRSLISNTPDLDKYLSAVFSGASEMLEIGRDIGSPLANVLDWIELKPFSLDDTAKFIREASHHEWADNFVEEVYTLTGGHPFLMQYVMEIVSNYDSAQAFQSLENAKKQFFNNKKNQFENWCKRFDNSTRAIYARLVDQVSLSRRTMIAEFGTETDRRLSILAHTGVIRLEEETDMIMISGSLFKEWFTQFGSIEVTPTLANQVDSLLKEVERQLRQLLTNHFDKKQPTWLQKHFQKNNQQKWQEIIRRAKKPAEANLDNQEVLKNTDLGDLFELLSIGSEWGELHRSNFTKLNYDSKTAKSRLEERKNHLVFVRNKLRHVNESDLSIGDLIKGQAFCTELLEYFATNRPRTLDV